MGRIYDKRRWRDGARKRALIEAGHKCKACGKPIKGRDAHVHHRFRVKDHPGMLFEPKNLEALCRRHHSRETAREMGRQDQARMGCDIEGWPQGPDHPWNKMARELGP